MLSHVGPVTTAESVEQALELLKREKFDLLVSDLTLPGMNGVELIRRAQAEHLIDGRRIMVVTGEPTTNMLVAWVRQQGIRMVQKPFTLQEFMRELRRVLPKSA